MNEQQEFWSGKEGDTWTKRLETIQSAYNNWEADSGVKLKDLLQEFFSGIPKDSQILEVGCGPGWVLKTLQDLNFTKLRGLDINAKAIQLARETHKNIEFQNVSIEEYRNIHTCDLVVTSAFLIHIHPDNLEKVMEIIYDTSLRYIFGRELSSTSPENCPIEGRKGKWENQYWTRRFKAKWLELYPDLKVVKYKLIPMMSKQYIQTEVYLLEK